MFQLETMTEAALISVTNRTETHGDERKPAVSLGLEFNLPNTVLDSIDPTLREALYKAKPDEEQELPGMVPTTPILRCNSIDRVTLPTTYNGWTLAVDDGIDDTQPMVFGGCKVDKFSLDAKQGGTVVLRLRVGTSDIDAERLGKLGMHNGQGVWVTIRKPEVQPDAIDGSAEAFEADHPGAEDLFAAGDSAFEKMDEAIGEASAEPADDITEEPDPVAQDAAEFERGMKEALGNRAPVSEGVRASRERMRKSMPRVGE